MPEDLTLKKSRLCLVHHQSPAGNRRVEAYRYLEGRTSLNPYIKEYT